MPFGENCVKIASEFHRKIEHVQLQSDILYLKSFGPVRHCMQLTARRLHRLDTALLTDDYSAYNTLRI